MNTYELIEMAVLDALGILEPEERDRLEAALERASPEVRAMVAEEQGRLLDLGDLLPGEAPRPELRELVVAAVRAAMREEGVAMPAGRVGPATSGRRRGATFRPAKRVSRMWRAAAVAMGALLVGMTAVALDLQRVYQLAGARAGVDRLYDNLGPDAADKFLFDSGHTRLVATMTPVSETAKGQAVVWHNPDWSSARLYVKQLKTEPNERLRVVVLDEAGNVVSEVAQFQSTGGLSEVEVRVDVRSNPRLAICRTTDRGDEVLLRTQL